MKLSEIAARLNGVSTPLFGVSWTPATSDVEVARSVIAYLEGRRLLYDSHELTSPYADALRRIERSVLEIRTFLTDTMVKGGLSSELDAMLREMRFACMNLLAAIDRYQDFATSTAAASLTPDLASAMDEAIEDRVANAVLFRGTMKKLMVEIGSAFSLPVPRMP